MDGTDGAYWVNIGMLNTGSDLTERYVCVIISGHWNSGKPRIRRKVENYISDTFCIVRDLMLAGF